MRKLLNIFFVRELRNFLWIYLITIVLLATLDVMFSSEKSVVFMVYSFCLIFPVILPFFWKMTFARNLNWILLLPISKKKVFWAHCCSNFLVFVLGSFSVFFLLKIHPFFSSVHDNGGKDAFYYIFRSPKMLWDLLFSEPVSGWLILIIFLVLALIFTTFFGVYGASHYKTSFNERSIKKAKRNYKKDVKKAIKVFIAVSILFLLRHYLFNPFTFLALCGFIILFFTVERTTYYLKTPNNLRRKFLKISVLVPAGVILISFLLSLHNIKKGGPQLASDGIAFMRNLSFTLYHERVLQILQSDISADSIRTITQLRYYKNNREKLLSKLNFKKAVKSKTKTSQLKALISILDLKRIKRENIYAFLDQIDEKNYPAIITFYFKTLERTFTANEVNNYLKKKNPAYQTYGILLAKHFRNADTLRLLRKIKKAPFDSNYNLRETLSYMMGYQVTDEKLYRFIHENSILAERKYNCENGVSDILGNIGKGGYCFLKTMDFSNKKHVKLLRKCGWFVESNKSCLKDLELYYKKAK